MRFPAKKRWHSLPPSGCLGTPLPLPQSVRTDGRTDVRTDGHVSITSQRLTGYHISLAMELRWRALPAGSAIKRLYGKTLHKTTPLVRHGVIISLCPERDSIHFLILQPR